MKNEIVTVNLPRNLREEERYLFTPFASYRLSTQTARRLRNIFVTYNGFCIEKNRLMKECHHSYQDQYQDYLEIAAHYLYDTTLHPENMIQLGAEETYLVIHHPWYNYYHWICESIFRAWMVRDELDRLVLLLPVECKLSDFIMNSLLPFKFKDIYFIPENKCVSVPNLVLPQIKPLCDQYHRAEVFGIREVYFNFIDDRKDVDMDLGERIYVSRKKAGRRKIVNESEIESILIKHGFAIVNNEEYSFLQQVSYFSKAKYLISIHGSGLTNMLFMRSGSSVLEFHKKKTNPEDKYNAVFWHLADCLGFGYYHQICDPTDEGDNNFNANFIVDPERLDANISLMLSEDVINPQKP